MSQLKVRVPLREEPEKKKTRIKPAGWLAIAVVVILALSLGGLAAQKIYWATRGIEALPTSAPVPTWTPTPTRTPTPTPVLPTPTPEGWSRAWDPVTKQEYLVPPPEVEAQIREAFNAVLGYLVVEDADDETLKKYSRPDIHQYVVSSLLADWTGRLVSVEIRALGPEGPVRCSDYMTCTVSRAALGFAGYVVFVDDQCPSRPRYRPAPCVVRTEGEIRAVSDAPYGRAFIATVRKEEGQWRIVNWSSEPLPQPPSSSP